MGPWASPWTAVGHILFGRTYEWRDLSVGGKCYGTEGWNGGKGLSLRDHGRLQVSTGTPSQWPMMNASKNLALLCSVTILGCPHSQEWALSLPLHPDLVLSPPRCPATSVSLCLFPAEPPWTPVTRQCPPSLPMGVPHSDFRDTQHTTSHLAGSQRSAQS